jgi:hypothetical protein
MEYRNRICLEDAKEYYLVETNNVEKLNTTVTEYLKNGWQLWQSTRIVLQPRSSIHVTNDKFTYQQILIK